MTTPWQSEALGWLGIDVWQQHRPVVLTEVLAESTETAAEPQTRAAVDTPAEPRSVSEPPTASSVPAAEPVEVASESSPVAPVALPETTPTDTAAVTLRIEAPAEGALRMLAERIARVGRLPAASIVIVASEQAAVHLGEQRWAFSDLVAEPARKRDLWRRLCRR